MRLELEEEQRRQAQWKKENDRRKHNYVPLIFELLNQLAKKKQTKALFEEAQKRQKEKAESKKDKKME